MARVTVQVFVRTSRRWKWRSMESTLVVSAARRRWSVSLPVSGTASHARKSLLVEHMFTAPRLQRLYGAQSVDWRRRRMSRVPTIIFIDSLTLSFLYVSLSRSLTRSYWQQLKLYITEGQCRIVLDGYSCECYYFIRFETVFHAYCRYGTPMFASKNDECYTSVNLFCYYYSGFEFVCWYFSSKKPGQPSSIKFDWSWSQCWQNGPIKLVTTC